MQLAPQTVKALVLVISGDSGSDQAHIGIHLLGPKLESFLRGWGAHMATGNGSRLPIPTTALLGTA
jgi:hypothetical protein